VIYSLIILYMTQYFKRTTGAVTLVYFLLPLLAYGATPTNFKEAMGMLIGLLQLLFAVLFALISVGLLYGVVLFLANTDNEGKREQIKPYLLWGVIGIAVVISLWGILEMLGGTFGVSAGIILLDTTPGY